MHLFDFSLVNVAFQSEVAGLFKVQNCWCALLVTRWGFEGGPIQSLIEYIGFYIFYLLVLSAYSEFFTNLC